MLGVYTPDFLEASDDNEEENYKGNTPFEMHFHCGFIFFLIPVDKPAPKKRGGKAEQRH